MNKVLFSLCLILASGAMAGEVNFAWSPSPSGASEPLTYLLRAGTNTLTGTNLPLVKLNVGTNLTAKVDFVKAGTWFFDVRAVDTNGVQSESSNEIRVDVPEAPGTLRTVVLQYSHTVNGSFTNAGFFRVYVQ